MKTNLVIRMPAFALSELTNYYSTIFKKSHALSHESIYAWLHWISLGANLGNSYFFKRFFSYSIISSVSGEGSSTQNTRLKLAYSNIRVILPSYSKKSDLLKKKFILYYYQLL